MSLFDSVIEERIAAAYARGEFDNLPGAGKPQALDDDTMVPEDVRAAYRVLKNAGFVPPEIEQRRELHDVEARLARALAPAERTRLHARWLALTMAVEAARGAPLAIPAEYRKALLQRLVGVPHAADADDSNESGAVPRDDA